MTNLMRNFHDDFRQTVREHGQRPALIDARQDRTIDYAALLVLIERYGALFQRTALRPGARVLAMVPNSLEALTGFLATAFHGYGYAPLSPDASLREVTAWVDLVRPELALLPLSVSREIEALVTDRGIPVQHVPADGAFDWLPAREDARRQSTEPTLLLTTSGSTGAPRAMVMSVDRLWSSGRAFCGMHRFVDENARFLNILPMSYLGGLFNLGLIPLTSGGSVVITEAFSGKSFFDFWQTVERFGINVLWLVPAIIRGLLKVAERTRRHEIGGAAQGIRACFVGTAPIDLKTKQAFETTFGIPALENFALSETTFFTSETLDTRTRRSEGSVGEVLPYVSVDILPLEAADEHGRQPTEIRVKSPFLFKGYLQADGTVDLPLDGDGYLRTGDLGHLERGDVLVIDGRRRDIVKKGGHFVPLRAIEVLAEQYPDVAEAAAVGVPHDFYGESLVLYLRLNGAVDGQWVTRVFSPWLHGNLVKHMWPERVLVVDDFPRTASGKVRKHLLAVPAGGR